MPGSTWHTFGNVEDIDLAHSTSETTHLLYAGQGVGHRGTSIQGHERGYTATPGLDGSEMKMGELRGTIAESSPLGCPARRVSEVRNGENMLFG